jgi:hypothetical protein
MSHHYWATFVELIRTPFLHLEMIWGIVPLGWARRSSSDLVRSVQSMEVARVLARTGDTK